MPQWNQTTWYSEEFPDCAIIYHVNIQLAVGAGKHKDRVHTWQQYSVTISEDVLTKCGFDLRYIALLNIDNNPITLAGDWRHRVACRTCTNWSAQSPKVGIFNEATNAGSLPLLIFYTPLHDTKGPGKQSKRFHFQLRRADHSLAESRTWVCDVFTTVLKSHRGKPSQVS